MNEYIAYTIPIGTYSYVLYNYYNNRFKKNADEEISNLEKKNNTHDFLEDIAEYCGNSKDECLLSHNITQATYNEIRNSGLNNYLDKLKRNPKVFETDKEYVFIFKENEITEENEKGNMFNIYHVSPIINQDYVANSSPLLEEKCGKGKCDLLKIMRQIKDVSDKYDKGGFIEYYWFDVQTRETIIKKSFVMKVSNVEYNGEKTNLYIGSGHTVKKIKKVIDHTKLNLLLINCILFISAWIFFNVKKTLKKDTLSFIILIIGSIYLSSLMFDSFKVEYSIDVYEKHLANIIQSSQIMAMFTGSVIIYLNLIKQKHDSALYQLLVIALLFTLFASIYYTSQDTDIFGFVYTLKKISIMNASLTLFLLFILVTLKKILH